MTSNFQPLYKALLSQEQLDEFPKSPTYQTIISYIELLNNAIVGVKLTDQCSQSPGLLSAVAIIDKVEEIAKNIPPVENAASRFGNPAFRTFYDTVKQRAPELVSSLPNMPSTAVEEVSGYLIESWGNRQRIDYGSGMELNFLCWMLCLEQLGVVQESDHIALVTRVFWRYLTVMRYLQSTYWLEPAGSHGVWGLDDYHFLPFLWGAAQLKGHRFIRPRAIHDIEVVNEYAKDYIYFSCIQFINSIKTSSLQWNSPMLNDISAVKTWDKINSGMIKMYIAEVLGKLPVMQHFLFGSILPYTGPPPPNERSDHPGHDHSGHVHLATGGWGDCCGIPVPSAFGAAREMQQGLRSVPGAGVGGISLGSNIRPVPFD